MKNLLLKNPEKYVLFLALTTLLFVVHLELLLGNSQISNTFLSAIPLEIPLQYLPWISQFFPILLLINALFAWNLAQKVFKNHLIGFLFATFCLISPMVTILETIAPILLWAFSIFWLLVSVFFAFFSQRSFFLYPVLATLLSSIYYLIMPTEYMLVIIITAIIMAFSFSTIIHKSNTKYIQFIVSFGISLLIFYIFHEGFSSNTLTPSLAFDPLAIHQYINIPQFYLQNHSSQYIFFPGILLVFVASLGIIFYWYRFILLFIFFISTLFFSFGGWEIFWKNLELPSQIFLFPLIVTSLFFVLVFVNFSQKNKRVWLHILEFIFVFILLAESFHLSQIINNQEQTIIHQQYVENIPEEMTMIKSFLDEHQSSLVLDEKNTFPRYLYQTAGIKNAPISWLQNENYLTLAGVSLVFSDKISSPNPSVWQKLDVAGKEGWYYQPSLPPYYLRDKKKLTMSNKLDFRVKNKHLDFSNTVYGDFRWREKSAIKTTRPSIQQKITIISKSPKEILLKVHTTKPTFFITSELGKFSEKNRWVAIVNKKKVNLSPLNIWHQGILLDEGVHKIELRKKDFELNITPHLKREILAILLLLILEIILNIYWKNRSKPTK